MTDDFYMTHGYARMAHRVVCVDLDGTLYERAPLYTEPDPLPGAAEAVRRLRDAGYRIVIFTSRLSPTWLEAAGYTASDQHDRIESLLRRDSIPFDAVTSDKIPAAWYIDDRGLRFDGDWKPIADFILWHDSGAGDVPE